MRVASVLSKLVRDLTLEFLPLLGFFEVSDPALVLGKWRVFCESHLVVLRVADFAIVANARRPVEIVPRSSTSNDARENRCL